MFGAAPAGLSVNRKCRTKSTISIVFSMKVNPLSQIDWDRGSEWGERTVAAGICLDFNTR